MRQPRITVLAYGEGEDERIFLRHLVDCYCRRHLVSVQTGSAGGGSPISIFGKALQARRGEIRDVEFILLDTDKEWPVEMIEGAEKENIRLIGNSPSLEALFFQILDPDFDTSTITATTCKKEFEKRYCEGNNFDEDNCTLLFAKAVLNDARTRIPNLDYIINSMEGNDVRHT